MTADLHKQTPARTKRTLALAIDDPLFAPAAEGVIDVAIVSPHSRCYRDRADCGVSALHRATLGKHDYDGAPRRSEAIELRALAVDVYRQIDIPGLWLIQDIANFSAPGRCTPFFSERRALRT